MLAVKPIRSTIFAIAICLGFVFAGCGGNGSGGGEETVFLYVTNGYPGASSLTLYGPTGTLVSGLEFGERSEILEVDRNTNSDQFSLIFDGAPTEIELSKALFSMYPQETGTLVISRRSGEEAANATLYRHVRTPDPTCVMIFGNSLSLNNSMLADEFLSYSYQTEWNVDPAPMYRPDDEGWATTRCGYTKVPDRYGRAEIHPIIEADPWFFPVSSDGSNYTLVWATRGIDPRTGEARSEGLTVNGQVMAVPTTDDFVACLSGAVSVEEQEEPEGGADAGSADAPSCPEANGPVGPDNQPSIAETEVIWDPAAVSSCFEAFSYTGFPVDPGQTDSYQAFSMSAKQNVDPDNPDDYICGSPVRVRTPVADLIFQDVDDSVPGFIEGDGGFIEIDAFFPISEQHFFVLYGRPVNAFVSQWNGGETAKPLAEHPYPGNKVPVYDN
jgi:hypothetical protein